MIKFNLKINIQIEFSRFDLMHVWIQNNITSKHIKEVYALQGYDNMIQSNGRIYLSVDPDDLKLEQREMFKSLQTTLNSKATKKYKEPLNVK